MFSTGKLQYFAWPLPLQTTETSKHGVSWRASALQLAVIQCLGRVRYWARVWLVTRRSGSQRYHGTGPPDVFLRSCSLKSHRLYIFFTLPNLSIRQGSEFLSETFLCRFPFAPSVRSLSPVVKAAQLSHRETSNDWLCCTLSATETHKTEQGAVAGLAGPTDNCPGSSRIQRKKKKRETTEKKISSRMSLQHSTFGDTENKITLSSSLCIDL